MKLRPRLSQDGGHGMGAVLECDALHEFTQNPNSIDVRVGCSVEASGNLSGVSRAEGLLHW